MSTILTVQGVTKRFGTRQLLKGVSFAIAERERVALIGANGSGKSTLLRMLVCAIGGAEQASALPGGAPMSTAEREAMEPDDGVITWRKGLVVRYVAQEPAFASEATVQSVLDGSGAAAHDIASIHSRMAMPPMNTRIDSTSIGERRRVALGAALLCAPDVLCLDEPTNHLDMQTIEWLEQHLTGFAGALLLVTHDRYFLDRVASRIVEIEHGVSYNYPGDYTEFLFKQAERHTVASQHEHERSMFVRREIEWIRRAPQARGTKAKARIERFDDALAAAPSPDEATRKLALRLPPGPRLGGTIIELKGVTKSHGDKRLFSNLTLTMKPGDRIGIVGPNGVGKTTLIRTILGELPPDAGTVKLGQNTQIAYMDQSRSALDDNATVLQEVADGSDYVELPDERVHVRTFLKMMLFPDPSGMTRVGQLSGGERNRVQLAKLLRRGGNVLVLDEPTNDLDIVTLGALEDALINFPGCALIVSHDRWFLDRVVTGILALEGDGYAEFYEGSYTSYAEKRKGEQAAALAGNTAGTTSTASGASRGRATKDRPRKLTFKERAELAAMEATILAAETAVTDAEAVLNDPETHRTRRGEIAKLTTGLEAARREVEHLYARWQELADVAAAEPM
ncbi:MAG: ATP-binding cassette domain-containing protein [Myxococcales bacterium]|nr:ATP-binding cassette domain-containing protein [Myxococcales bacterium]